MNETYNTPPFSLPFEGKITHIPVKRAFDILFSLAAILLTLPLSLVLALAIKISSRGKIIYSHERIGRGGVPFRCYKFRTMYDNADQRLKTLLAQDPLLLKEWDQTHKLKNDPRVTPLGKILRKTSLDELPQFWNVLVGDLSVVGPRPLVKAELMKYYGDKSAKILSIRPGLTCVWQVSGRNNLSYDLRLQMDANYVENRTLLWDLKLIAKTIPTMIFPKGAY